MPQLPRQLVKERGARLREKGEEVLGLHLAGEVGKIRPVLIEKEGLGRTEQFTQTEITGGNAGEILTTRITGHTGRHLLGEVHSRAA
jgi:threonylcarbamoyladenosine tRNA methylthiotransferase MtaB